MKAVLPTIGFPVIFGIFLWSCNQSIATGSDPGASIPPKTAAFPDSTMPAPANLPAPPSPTCENRIAEVVLSPPDKLLSAYTKSLAYILLEVKVEPVIYLTAPKPGDNPPAQRARAKLRSAHRTRRAVADFIKRHRDNRAFLRDVFLSQGYFFEASPSLAAAMVQEISLSDLYDAPVIYRWRENRIERLERQNDIYVDEAGTEAVLHLNARTGLDPADLAQPLHLDITYLRNTTHALYVRPTVVGATDAAVDWVFPSGERRRALVSLRNRHTELTCIGGDQGSLSSTAASAARFWERHRRVVRAAERITDERPIFDEPKDEGEDVQEDGELRQAWKEAYYARKRTFNYREVEYEVYDRRGNPVPPEVCIDFILDTWERASGTWYTSKGAPPKRTEGAIDFNVFGHFGRRYIASILNFALQEGSPFDRYDVPRRRWIPLTKRRRFAKNLPLLSAYIREGDVLVIHGLRDEDQKEHFHTVLVLATDPITGLPVLVADNQGRPRISSLKSAMRSAPRRSIKYRIRLNYDAAVRAAQLAKAAEKATSAETSAQTAALETAHPAHLR